MTLKKHKNSFLPVYIALVYLTLALSYIFYLAPLLTSNLSGFTGLWILLVMIGIVEFPLSLIISALGLGGFLNNLPTDSKVPFVIGVFINTVLYYFGARMFFNRKNS